MMTKEQVKANQAKEKKAVKRPVGPVRQGPVTKYEESNLLALQLAVTRPDLANQADILALQRQYGNKAVQRHLDVHDREKKRRGRGSSTRTDPGAYGGQVQRMTLKSAGEKALTLSGNKKGNLADNLMNKNAHVNTYITGVCHDAVAFVKHMLDPEQITADDVRNITGNAWIGEFSYQDAFNPQKGIKPGAAVGFADARTGNVFHSALAVGGKQVVRGINGSGYGDDWTNGPCDINELYRMTDVESGVQGYSTGMSQSRLAQIILEKDGQK